MAEPFRLLVQKRLCERLEQIKREDGPYRYDLAGKVFRGRSWFGEDDPIPLLAILEAPLPQDPIPTPNDNPTNVGRWELLIQGFIDDDPTNPTDPAQYLMADVKAKLAEIRQERVPNAHLHQGNPYNVLGLGRSVQNIQIHSGAVRPPDELSAKAYFWLSVTLQLVEDLSKPFEQI